MKYLKVTCLFFLIFSLLQIISCNKKEHSETSKKPSLDSVSIYIKRMKNASFGDTVCLKYANKALKIAKKTNLDSKNIEEILNGKIYLSGNLNQFDSAINSSKELLQLAIKRNDSASIGSAYSKMAYYYSRNKQNDSAYYYYNLIKNEYLKYNDSITTGNNLLGMAIIESSIGDYNASEYTGSLALKYLNGKSPNSSSGVYNNWAISSRKQGQLKDALIFYKKAIELTSIKEHKIIIENNIANTYRDLGDYHKSIKILDSLKRDTIMNLIERARITDNLAYTKWLANRKENVLPELEKALGMRQLENDSNGLIASYAHLSKYFENLNPEASLSYASKMYDIATIQKSTQDQLEALQRLIVLDNAAEIRKYYTLYTKINDSVNTAQSKAKNQYAKIKYDSEKNREENLQLKISTSLKELELEKEKTKNIITYSAGGSFFLVLLIFMYHRKQKHKIEKRTEIYKTEKRIAKKIHDEVANNVVNIMNKVQYTENPKNVLLDDLEKVYLLTRNISHENNAIETGEKFEYFLKTMLTGFNNTQTTIILKDIHKVALAKIAKEKQIELYRILQELMVNMRKHSEASLVAITFQNIKNHYTINYSDNGIGLNLDELTFKNGLSNVETRIKSINGTITFDTAINNGFKAFISFKN